MPGGLKLQIIFKLACWTLLLYFAYCCFLFLIQRQMLFPRYVIEEPAQTAEDIPGLEKIWLDTAFGKV